MLQFTSDGRSTRRSASFKQVLTQIEDFIDPASPKAHDTLAHNIAPTVHEKLVQDNLEKEERTLSSHLSDIAYNDT